MTAAWRRLFRRASDPAAAAARRAAFERRVRDLL